MPALNAAAVPSLYEPFGIAPLEAMAYQLPCVVTNGWALAETVTPGETGALVEPGRTDDLADTLIQLLKDPAGLARMGANARTHFERLPGWGYVARRIAAAMGLLAPATAAAPDVERS